jgi:hypothetical protein
VYLSSRRLDIAAVTPLYLRPNVSPESMKMSSRVEHLQKRHSDEPRREKHWRRCDINLHRSFPPECRTSIRTKAAATHNPDPWISFCVCRRRCSLRPSCLQLQELVTNFLTVAEPSEVFLLIAVSFSPCL